MLSIRSLGNRQESGQAERDSEMKANTGSAAPPTSTYSEAAKITRPLGHEDTHAQSTFVALGPVIELSHIALLVSCRICYTSHVTV